MKTEQMTSLWGFPVVVTDTVSEGTALVGSFPEPERANMTVKEYAEQCTKYWYKLRIQHDAQNN